MADTRKDKRAPVSLKVRFKSATVDEFIEQYCRDVSRGGIFIKSSQPMPIGTLLKFQLQLKDESSLIKGVGRVVWTRSEDDASSEAPAGMGIKFIKMDGDSRVVVDRVVGAHGGAPGAYDQGEPETGLSEPPPSHGSDGGGFFPNLPAAVLPPPEDRTAVRHAAQFLASALSEGGTDQAASREAEQKAEEARRRTAQIEAQRLAEAESQKKAAQGSSEGLPSMIIDPSLSMPPPAAAGVDEDRPTYSDPRKAPSSERPTTEREKPKAPAKQAAQGREEHGNEDTSITERRQSATAAGTAQAEPARKSNALPVVVIVLVVAAAAVLALSGDRKPQPNEPAMIKPLVEAPAAEAPAPVPAPALVPEPAPVAEPTPEPTPEPVPAPEPVEMVSLKVSTVPDGADIFVGDESRGKSPLTLELPKGQMVRLRAKLAGRAEATQEITVAGKLKPVKLSLPLLPYVLHVDTTPAGATVFVGSKRGTTPVDLELSGPPKGPLSVTARLAGHESSTTTVAATTFQEFEQAMRSSVSLTLVARAAPTPAPTPEVAPVAPKPKPKPVVKPAPKPVEPTPAPVEAAPKPVEPAPRPVIKPKPEPKPEPAAEPIPDNPFG